jgi:hypothetical protein
MVESAIFHEVSIHHIIIQCWECFSSAGDESWIVMDLWGMMGLQNAVNLPLVVGGFTEKAKFEMSTTHQQQVWAVWGFKQRTSDLTNKHVTYKT